MKKLNVILGASLLLMATSCKVQMATSTSMPIDASITSRSTAQILPYKTGTQDGTRFYPAERSGRTS